MNDEWPCDLASEIFQISNRCTKFRKGFLKNKQKLNFYKLLSLACYFCSFVFNFILLNEGILFQECK